MRMKWHCLLAIVTLSGCTGGSPSTRSKGGIKTVTLFDGKSLGNWRHIEFADNVGISGAAGVSDGTLTLAQGDPMSGMVFDPPAGSLPTGDYEFHLEAMRTDGNDFFCGLTFPVPSQDSCCTLIVGGWGGTLVGLSNVNGMDASHNTTRFDRPFDSKRWYKIRVAVSAEFIDVWIDGTPVIELDITSRKIDMRPGGIEQCQPIGLATWRTAGAFRNLKLKIQR